MPVLAIIQARLGSSRFPRKALADLAGRPLIAHVVDRVRRVRGVDDVVLAVPPKDSDEFLALGLGVRVWAPDVDERDVLTRFVAVAAMYSKHDTIMRVTGDCPLWSPGEGERVLRLFRSIPNCTYAWNVAPGYVDGDDCEVFSREALLQAHWHSAGDEREHVTPRMRATYPVVTAMPLDGGYPRKTSVDTVADLEYVRTLIERAA